MNIQEKEKTALGRFEIIAERYVKGTQEEKDLILSFFNEKEQYEFLKGVGYYRLFTAPRYYKAVRSALCEVIYKEANAKRRN